MYAAYFGLKQEPFSIAPDPRLLFMSGQHREALAHLLYGVQGGGGFVLLTGEIGTGKTTVCRSFLEQVPAHCNLAYIFNPKLTVLELLETVCHEFGVGVAPPAQRAATVKDYLDPLNAFLLRSHAQGRNNVLVIDEAQNLSADVLEQLRLLTNLETSERKLLQIILIGQPELRDMLARPELEQLAQRVIARYHLGALSEAESAEYVRHRMEVSGLQRPLPFDRAALRNVHRATGGVPRRINLLCDRALLGAYANGDGQVTRGIVRKAATEVFPRVPVAARAWPRTALAGLAGLAAGAGILAAAHRSEPEFPRVSLTVTSRIAETAPVAASLPAVAPEPAPAAVPVSPPPTLLRSQDEAWRELAQAWKLPLPSDGEPCAALAREQVHCFSRDLGLPLIRQLARPGIVTLDAETGQPSYAILTALTHDSATLRAAGTEQTVTLAALARRWKGDFATLWRAPEGYGDKAAPVQWMASRLAAARGAPAPVTRVAFDEGLRAELRAFQLAQGLPADGRPGPLTSMQLNRAGGPEEPRLRTQP
ncbi:MAG TPA: AAA family ATPase [Ramlibacter sp.]|nr:AAA family ATPase [Ramlibacter sp.]